MNQDASSDSDIKELYQQVILEHNSHPHNFKELENYTHKCEGYNPLCGDHLFVYINLNGEQVNEISFTGQGCAISKASASIMTEILENHDREYCKEIFQNFRDLVMGKKLSIDEIERLGKLQVFSNISQYPSRIKCAILAWYTLMSAMKGETISSSE